MKKAYRCELCRKEEAVAQWHIYLVCANCYIKKTEQEQTQKERRENG